MTQMTNLYRLPPPYAPAAEIEGAAERFWKWVDRPAPLAFDQIDSRCWPWIKPRTPNRNWEWVETRGRRIEVRRYAYLLQVDEVWPGLVVRSICGLEWCVRGDHLAQRRSISTRGVRYGTMSDEEVRATQRLRLASGRRVHRQFRSLDDVARAYGVTSSWLVQAIDRLRD